MFRKSPYIDENYATLMSSDLNLVLMNSATPNVNFEENSLNFSKMSAKKIDEEKSTNSRNFNSILEETPEKSMENPLIRKKKNDNERLSIFNKTFNMLLQGAKENVKIDEVIRSEVKCLVCGNKSNEVFLKEKFISCPLCKGFVCPHCVSKCSECFKTLCKICTVVNYDLTFDRVLCLECNK